MAFQVPMNIRPRSWRTERMGNYLVSLPVALDADDRRDLASAAACAAVLIEAFKRTGGAGLPYLLARLPQAAIAPPRSFPTSGLSNLGELAPFDDFGPGCRVVGLLMSPHVPDALGLGVGAAGLDGRLWLTLRFAAGRFSREDARTFRAHLRGVMLGRDRATSRDCEAAGRG
jgi:hypothetical protein